VASKGQMPAHVQMQNVSAATSHPSSGPARPLVMTSSAMVSPRPSLEDTAIFRRAVVPAARARITPGPFPEAAARVTPQA